MVDNVTIPAQGTGTTTPVIATDDVGPGVHYQVIKLAIGGDGAATLVSNSNPIPISDANTTLSIDDGAGSLTIDGTVGATQSGVWNIGTVTTVTTVGTVTAVTALTNQLPAGTNNIGDVDVLTVPANPFGANADAGVAGAGSMNAHLRYIAETGIQAIITPVTVNSHAVTNAGTFATQASGNVAHDVADALGPVKVGGRARSSEITAVANDDRSDFMTDLVGKQIVLPYANPENFVSGTTSAMTGTTSTSVIAVPGAGLRNYVTTIIVTNSHATVSTDVAIQDGSGGTTLMTIPAAAVYGGAVITLPTPLRQPTLNTALFCVNLTTGASTKVTAVGYKGA